MDYDARNTYFEITFSHHEQIIAVSPLIRSPTSCDPDGVILPVITSNPGTNRLTRRSGFQHVTTAYRYIDPPREFKFPSAQQPEHLGEMPV
ncbi:hypothetical protein GCM10007173_04030 [Glutamicibacter ardleyensis]|uniref:Uncharacterized protein n=1 Tax=Glutamicibacter ardleyensis TaxID=225894 RepID=A0ABQ2D8Z3_9MICC|nr:hypothetical protein GCM10007173_04030 [Glutamicibacter ardleyensis]